MRGAGEQVEEWGTRVTGVKGTMQEQEGAYK